MTERRLSASEQFELVTLYTKSIIKSFVSRKLGDILISTCRSNIFTKAHWYTYSTATTESIWCCFGDEKRRRRSQTGRGKVHFFAFRKIEHLRNRWINHISYCYTSSLTITRATQCCWWFILHMKIILTIFHPYANKVFTLINWTINVCCNVALLVAMVVLLKLTDTIPVGFE